MAANRKVSRNTRKPAPNRRKGPKKGESSGARARSAAVTLALITLCALGVWQCFDDKADSPLAPMPTPKAREIDAGGEEVDPTLLNEESLLSQEAPVEEATPSEPVEPEAEVSIEDAGEEVEADTDEEFEKMYPLHAVAYHFHTQIKQEPKQDSRVLAYARRGATFRLSERVSTKDCKKGWHKVAGGGYVCDGMGIKVSNEPITFEPSPPAPMLNESLPYSYMYARKDGVAEYWKIPSPEEVELTKKVFEAIDRRDNPSASPAAGAISSNPNTEVGERAEVPDGDEGRTALEQVLEKAEAKAKEAEGEGAPEAADSPTPPAPMGSSSDSNTETTGPAQAPEEEGRTAAEPEESSSNPAEAPEVEEARTDTDTAPEPDPYELPPYVHMKMAKGYYVSVRGTVDGGEVEYRKTVRGRYIRNDELYEAKPSTFEGELLGNAAKLPLVFVINGGTKILNQEVEDGPLKNGDKVERYSSFPYLGEYKRRGRTYVRIGDGKYLNGRVVRVAKEVEPPDDIGETERWIHVDLSEQTLVAYEGHVPVFATLVATGRVGFETPTGEFRIYNKHVTITMDDPDGGEEAYSIEDVPWTQYFDEGYALHTAFWHDRFGRVRSHGCVNLSPADARRLFFWTGPHVPSGVHGVIATSQNPGTRVVITE